MFSPWCETKQWIASTMLSPSIVWIIYLLWAVIQMGQFCNLIKRGELWYISQNNDVSESGHTSIFFWAAVMYLNLVYCHGKLVVYKEGFVACWERFKILRIQIQRIFKISCSSKWTHDISWLQWLCSKATDISFWYFIFLFRFHLQCLRDAQYFREGIDPAKLLLGIWGEARLFSEKMFLNKVNAWKSKR